MKLNQPMRWWAVLAACLAMAASNAAQTKSPTQSPGQPAAKGAYPAALLKPETLTAKAPEVFEVKFVTSKGEFVVTVTRAWAPQGADRFYNLVRNRFYDGAALFRVVPGFVVQFGLSAHPEVSRAWQRANIQDDPVVQSNKRGFVTYAKSSAPHSRTTQIFINLGDNARLDAMGFAPFGEVTQGMEVVEQLYRGYGEDVTDKQGQIAAQGNAYLEKAYPNLDYIKTARVVSPPPDAPATRPPAKKQ